MTSHVSGAAEWMIGPERDREGHEYQPVLEVQCRVCEEMATPSADQGMTDRWAMRHADLTGHRAFRETTIRYLTAHPAPTNPLYEQEQGGGVSSSTSERSTGAQDAFQAARTAQAGHRTRMPQ